MDRVEFMAAVGSAIGQADGVQYDGRIVFRIQQARRGDKRGHVGWAGELPQPRCVDPHRCVDMWGKVFSINTRSLEALGAQRKISLVLYVCWVEYATQHEICADYQHATQPSGSVGPQHTMKHAGSADSQHSMQHAGSVGQQHIIKHAGSAGQQYYMQPARIAGTSVCHATCHV
eukprot:351152-Chlamydomonas_euryale.AAC.4